MTNTETAAGEILKTVGGVGSQDKIDRTNRVLLRLLRRRLHAQDAELAKVREQVAALLKDENE